AAWTPPPPPRRQNRARGRQARGMPRPSDAPPRGASPHAAPRRDIKKPPLRLGTRRGSLDYGESGFSCCYIIGAGAEGMATGAALRALVDFLATFFLAAFFAGPFLGAFLVAFFALVFALFLAAFLAGPVFAARVGVVFAVLRAEFV